MSQQDPSLAAPSASPAAPLREAPGRQPAPAPAAAPRPGRAARLLARSWAREVLVLAGFLAAGVAATWPRSSFITGRLPLNQDQTQYVWSFWWVARQVTHPGNPWFTTHLAAPVGVQLGYDTLMPLLGVVMTPVTLLFGPSASYNLLTIVAPGLAAYAMYRAARLWLPSRAGAIAAGAFYGMSGMLASQVWLHIHTAIGAVFFPLTIEAAVRLRRDPGLRRGLVLGIVVGACVLIDQESAVLAGLLAVLVLVPWLLRRPGAAAWRAVLASAVTAVVIASPQVAAMAQAAGHGGPAPPPISNYVTYAAELPGLFAPAPRWSSYGMTWLGSLYNAHTTYESLATFGLVLTLLALLGLAAAWRRPAARKLGLLWLGSAILALGPTIYLGSHQFVPLAGTWHGLRVSQIMPYSWLIRVPGLSSFREPDRWAFLGLVCAALLAGAAVEWLRGRAKPLIIVVALLGAADAGWAGISGQPTAPTALPALDRPIAADHSGSVVVDVPFIIRGPERYGSTPSPYTLALATADGHPRGLSISSAVPRRTIAGISAHPFYSGLVAAQKGRPVTPAQLATARQDARALRVGWVLVWTRRWTVPGAPAPSGVKHDRQIQNYLTAAGFQFSYRADGVLVYRPSSPGG